jgi:hypothetical protein
MNTLIAIFNFNDWDRHMSMADALEEHSQIAEMMQEMHAVELAPNVFIIRTELSPDELLNEVNPFLDRGEDRFVLTVSAPYAAVSAEQKFDFLDLSL